MIEKHDSVIVKDKSSMLDALRDFCLQQGFDKTYWVAYSGGLDSHVLLSLCATLRPMLPVNFRVIHINHNISAHSKKWGEHCAEICKNYGMDYVERAIQIDVNAGDSFEEVARAERYAIFSEYLKVGDILLTAHQQDDQAETVLLQLFRGAGLKGLAAMPVIKPFAQGFHGRPLLHFSRSQLQSYAEEHQLNWIEDESNNDTKLTRNFIRHHLMPLLKSRWPTIAASVSRSASHCAESQVLLDELTTEEYKLIKGSRENTLSVKKLLCLNPTRQRFMLRKWIIQLGYPLPDTKKIETIRHNVLKAKWDRIPCVAWENTELRRYRDDLYLMPPLLNHDSEKTYSWHFSPKLFLPQVGVLCAQSMMGSGLRADIKEISIQFRKGGEKINLPGRGRHTLKNLFQEWQVLPWERDRIPLVFVAETLVCVVGYFLDADYKAKVGEMGYEFSFLPVVNEPKVPQGEGLLKTSIND